MGKRSREKRATRAAAPSAPAETTAVSTTPSSTAWMLAGAIAVVTIAIFSRVAHDQFIDFDDPSYVTQNPHVLTGLTWANVVWAFTHVHASYWHPLTWISHMIDVQLFGVVAGRHALVNVLFHVANSVLLLFALRRLTGSTWRSAAVAALFALHPLHVESVAWVTERKDVLSTLFFLLALLFYAQRRRWLTVAAFACGLMSKPMVITLPFVLLLLDWWPLGRWSPRALPKLKTPVIEKWPLFLLVPFAALTTLFTQKSAMAAQIGLPIRLANAVSVYPLYLAKAFVPIHLIVTYPLPTTISLTAALLSLAFIVAVTIGVLALSGRFPYLAVGWLWFFGMIVPVSGIVQVGQGRIADRFMYVPLIAILIACVWLIADLIPNRAALGAMTAAVLIPLCVLTYIQLGFWRDSLTLWTHAIAVDSSSSLAHVNLGAAYLQHLDYNAAAEQYRAATALSPHEATAHTGLGLSLAGLGDMASAQREFETAMKLDPTLPQPYRGLARIELASGRRESAIPLLQKSLTLAPDDESAQGMLATAQGRLDDAIAHYRKEIEQEPDAAEGHNDLGAVLAKRGDDNGALAEYETALRIAPSSYDTIMNAGALLSRMNRDGDAAAKFADAAKLRPRSPEPHVYLALIYANGGRMQDAINEVRTAAGIDADLANVEFTNAVHIPFKPTNLAEFLGALEQKAAGRG